MLSNNNPARGHHLRGRWAEIPARLQRGHTNRNFVAARPPKSRAHVFPFSNKYRTQQVLHICYAIDMQHKFRVRVGAGRKTCLRSLSVSGAIAWSPGSTAISAGPEQPRSAMLAAHEAIDLVVMFRGKHRARANSGKCRQLYSSRVVIVGARDARPEAVDDGRRGDP